MNVLVILGHPRKQSLSGALAAAYAEGARAAGVNVKELILAELHFNPNVELANMPEQLFEADLAQAKRAVEWADHLVFVYPTWWGTMPALLKGFLDRMLMPGFAFEWRADGSWSKLLTGKSAQAITTMDTPGFVYRWIYGQPGHNMLKRATLNFCGIDPVRINSLGTVHDSTPEQRARWVQKARAMGRSLPRGILTESGWLRRKIGAWILAIRLQFYPMTFMAYTIGAFATGSLSGGRYWLGYLCVFLLEFITVLVNEYCDFATDQRNRNAGPFNGGSRVLIDKRLSQREIQLGLGVLGVSAVISGLTLMATADGNAFSILLILTLAAMLGIGYTAPPLKLAYRGWGEVNVGFTHSVLVIAAGFVFNGGSLLSTFPIVAGLPLFFAIVPAIILSGIPDREADQSVGKRTLVVRLGPPRAIDLAMSSVVIATVLGMMADWGAWAQDAYDWITPFILVHAGWLLSLLAKQRSQTNSGRIDSLMIAALNFILWFVVVPLLNLA